MKTQTKYVLGVIVVIILIVAVLAMNNKAHVVSTSDKEPIKIGGISALTGVGVAIGEEERKGAQLAVDEINASGGVKDKNGSMHPLQLISEDLSIDKLKIAVSVVQKLISVDKVVAIIGPQWDEPTIPILPVIETAHMPTIGTESSRMLEAEHSYEYFFSTWFDNRVGIRELLRFVQKRGLTKIAIIKPISAGFWEYTASTFKKEAPNYGVTITDEIDLGNPLTLDFKTSLLKVREREPQAIFIVSSDYNQCTFLKQANQLGYKGITLGTESSGDPVSISQCEDLMQDRRFFSTPVFSTNYKAFAERFKTRFGDYPRFPSAATSYDAVQVIAKALEISNLQGGSTLKDAIQEVKGLKGVAYDSISFTGNGFIETAENAFEIQTVKNGQFVKVDY